MSHMKNRDSNRKRREDRQVQAKVRQESYDALDLGEKLAKLGNLTAAKQRARLVEQAKAPVVKPAAAKAEVEAPVKDKKGQKAKRQERKDKKSKGE